MWNFKRNIYRTRREDGCPDCTDHDVTIGTQTWTGCNADTEFYNNGNPIPYVDDAVVWASLTTGAWCWYDNNSANETIYGKLYNWYAVNDPRGIAPAGYHVPSDTEWTTLTTFLGGTPIAGGKMKEEGFCHWNTPNTDATNTSLFTGLPGGFRYNTGNFSFLNTFGAWWSSTERYAGNPWYRGLYNFNGIVDVGSISTEHGLSVRFIKDVVIPCPTCTDHDVTIGAQTWTVCNLDVDTYRDGTIIPEVSDPIAWAALTTGAWCWYANNSANGPIYGKLYNWHAGNDPRGLAPVGYHIPSNTEWTTLTTFLGGAPVAGGAVKETGFTHWDSPNAGATNSSCFTALGSGLRYIDGSYIFIKQKGYWWGSAEFDSTTADAYVTYSVNTGLFNVNEDKKLGFSVRLIKD